MIRKLSEIFLSGTGINFDFDGTSTCNTTTSPRSPLDHKIQSPRGLKNYDLGAVGLGIVIILNKSGGISVSEGGHEILAKHARCSTNMNGSGPISVDFSGKNWRKVDKKGGELLMEEEGLENHTCVTRNDCPNNTMSLTKVYYGGGDQCQMNNSRIRLEPKTRRVVREGFPVFPTSEFLSSCQLCKKKLHGEDIYMYRGEKAFCSAECRSRQIMIDERKEQCRSEVPRSVDVTTSSYTKSPIFCTGMFAI